MYAVCMCISGVQRVCVCGVCAYALCVCRKKKETLYFIILCKELMFKRSYFELFEHLNLFALGNRHMRKSENYLFNFLFIFFFFFFSFLFVNLLECIYRSYLFFILTKS